MPSKKTKYVRGLFLTVMSSADGITPVVSLGTRTDIKHWVKVENLGGYPADIDCRGRITAPHPVVKFSSQRTGDTATVWTEVYPGLLNSSTRDFSDVTLLPHSSGAAGTENVYTDLEINWPAATRREYHSLDILVSI